MPAGDPNDEWKQNQDEAGNDSASEDSASDSADSEARSQQAQHGTATSGELVPAPPAASPVTARSAMPHFSSLPVQQATPDPSSVLQGTPNAVPKTVSLSGFDSKHCCFLSHLFPDTSLHTQRALPDYFFVPFRPFPQASKSCWDKTSCQQRCG